MILDKINELLKEVETLTAKNAEDVEQLRLKYLSKKGEITALMNDFHHSPDERLPQCGCRAEERGRHEDQPVEADGPGAHQSAA